MRPAVATRGPAGERRGPESGRRDLSRDLSVESWGAGPQGSGPAQGLRAPWESALSESFAHESFRPRSRASSSMKPSWPSPLQRRGLPLPGGQHAVCLGHPLGGFVLGSLSRPFRPARHREGAELAQTVPKGKKRVSERVHRQPPPRPARPGLLRDVAGSPAQGTGAALSRGQYRRHL